MPKPSVTVTESPSSVGKSSTFVVKWTVKNGYPGKIGKTYVLSGIRAGQYTSTSLEQTGTTTASFQATLTAPASAPETLYFIVTSVVDGQSYNSTEGTLTVY
jgi:hypothetical protein